MKRALLKHYDSTILPGPLNGKVVLGFCYYVAGPIALQHLVSQGALVIKIERKPLGDPSRYVFSSAIFNTLTHSQLSVAIDYDTEADRSLLRQLLKMADVVVDNRSIRAKEDDRFLASFLKDSHRKMPAIYCSIDGFPNATVNRMTGLDASAQACTGLAYTNCFTQDRPLKVGIPLLDITTGLLAANYILANLVLLSQSSLPALTEKVIRIAVSLAGTSVWLQSNQFVEAMSGHEYFRVGNQDKYAAPFSYYTAKDGLISVATVNERQFEQFCTHVLEDPGFHVHYPTIQKRIQDQGAFERDLNQRLSREKKAYWLAKCKAHSIPAAPVLTVSQALRQRFVKNLMTSSDDGSPVVTHGATHSFFKKKKSRSAPALGQDNEDIRLVCTTQSKL